GWANVAVNGVAAVEVIDPWHARIVVVAAVDVGSDHRRHDVANIDREDALLRGRSGDAGVRRTRQRDPVVLVSLERLGNRLRDGDPRVRLRVLLGQRLVGQQLDPQLLGRNATERQAVVLLEDLHRAGGGRIDRTDAQRWSGTHVSAQHPVGQLERSLRGQRAGQRPNVRGPDEAVETVGKVAQARQRLLHRGDPRAGDRERDRAAVAELAVARSGGRRWNRQLVAGARLERRDRVEEL